MNRKIVFIFLGGVVALLLQAQAYHVDFRKAVKEAVPMSTVFEKVEYVKLETTPDCLLTPKTTYYLSSKYIIALNIFYDTFVFDRKTGKFLHLLGKSGNGPDEFKYYMCWQNGFDEKNSIVYAYDFSRWKGYSIETGKMVATIKTPYFATKYGSMVSCPWNLGNGNYIGVVTDPLLKRKEKVVVFDKNGTVKKVYYNSKTPDPQYFNRDDYPENNGLFYEFSGKLFMTQIFLSDTSYQVTKEKLIPHIITHTGNKPYGTSKEENAMGDRINLRMMRETNKYILFTYQLGHNAWHSYAGYYDKKTHQTYLCPTSNKENDYGFQNDIDGLLSFLPKQMNASGELIGRIIPEEQLEYIEKYGSVGLSPRAKKLIKGLQEDDNPIVVIATPK